MYELEASFLEIYNEALRDLLRCALPLTIALAVTSNELYFIARPKSTVAERELSIHHDKQGVTTVAGLSRVAVTSSSTIGESVFDDNRQAGLKRVCAIEGLVARAAKNRTVASTKMNVVSSRSHCVFTLYITGALTCCAPLALGSNTGA